MTLLREGFENRRELEEYVRQREENPDLATQEEKEMESLSQTIMEESIGLLEKYGARELLPEPEGKLARMGNRIYGFGSNIYGMNRREYFGRTEIAEYFTVEEDKSPIRVEISCNTTYPKRSRDLTISIEGIEEPLFYHFDSKSKELKLSSDWDRTIDDMRGYKEVVDLVKQKLEPTRSAQNPQA